MKKRLFALALTGALLMTALAGCGDKPAGDSSPSASPSTSPSASTPVEPSGTTPAATGSVYYQNSSPSRTRPGRPLPPPTPPRPACPSP